MPTTAFTSHRQSHGGSPCIYVTYIRESLLTDSKVREKLPTKDMPTLCTTEVACVCVCVAAQCQARMWAPKTDV